MRYMIFRNWLMGLMGRTWVTFQYCMRKGLQKVFFGSKNDILGLENEGLRRQKLLSEATH
jgi:hypothetical protein